MNSLKLVLLQIVIVLMNSLFIMGCNANSEGDDGLSVRMVYDKSLSFAGEDKEKYRKLKTGQRVVAASNDVDYSQIRISIHADRAKVEWGVEQSTSFAAPSAKAMEGLKAMNIDFYDQKNQLMIKKQEVVVWHGNDGRKFHTVVTDSNNYDVITKAVDPSQKKKQRVNRSRAAACDQLPTHHFRFPVLQSPCQIGAWIDSKYWIPTGRKKSIEVKVKRSVAGNFKREFLECEYYTGADNHESSKSGRCISFEGSVPFLLIDTVQGADGRRLVDQNSKLEYQLVTVDWSPKPEENEFNFDSVAVCGAPQSGDDSWVKC
ncbi:MAG: hypothetical protein ACI93R_001678 [Flavobacteriales bacterium]